MATNMHALSSMLLSLMCFCKLFKLLGVLFVSGACAMNSRGQGRDCSLSVNDFNSLPVCLPPVVTRRSLVASLFTALSFTVLVLTYAW